MKKILSMLGTVGLTTIGATQVMSMSLAKQKYETIETQLPLPIGELVPEFEIEQYYASLAIGQVMNQMITLLEDKNFEQFYSAKLEFNDSETNEIVLSVFDDNNDALLNLWNQIYSIKPLAISEVIYNFTLSNEQIIYENLMVTMISKGGQNITTNESVERTDLTALPNKDKLNLIFSLEI